MSQNQALYFFEMYVLFGYSGVTKGMERKWINLPESFLFLKKVTKKKLQKCESKYINSQDISIVNFDYMLNFYASYPLRTIHLSYEWLQRKPNQTSPFYF